MVHFSIRRIALIAVLATVVVLPSSGAVRPAAPSGVSAQALSAATAQLAAVVVTGDRASVEQAVSRLGGSFDFQLSKDTFAARLPIGMEESLRASSGISRVEADAPLISASRGDDSRVTPQVWQEAINAPAVWSRGIDGSGIGIAVLDTGIAPRENDSFVYRPTNAGSDGYGHGTHVAGIAAGNRINEDHDSGVAPRARVISVPAGRQDGTAYASDLVRAVDWVVANRKAYNIRVLNISASTGTSGSYLTSLVNAAVERAWFSGIVVVVSAGNDGAGSVSTAPANDPFVITVGAYDDRGTSNTGDDSLATWSAQGVTLDRVVTKPDVVAPGRHIVSLLANGKPAIAQQNPDLVIDGKYLNLSGTSMSAPVVSGIAALVLQKNPGLSPNEVKARIVGSGTPIAGSIVPRVDAKAAVFGQSRGSATQRFPINLLLADAAGIIDLSKAPWSSITWDSITWDSITWDSITWDSITWDSITWDSITWDSITWDSITWDSITWDAAMHLGDQ